MTSITRTRSKGYMPAKVHKTIVADRSGSMRSFNGGQYDMAEHLLQDAKKQAVDTQIPTDFTFVTFDQEVEIIMQDRNLLTEDIPLRHELEDSMCPRGITRFNDTLIEQVNALNKKKEKYLATLSSDARKLNPDVAMVLIAITDGMDNASKHTVAEAREIMVKFRKNGGRAILMAANMDAEVIGGRYGFNPEKAITVHNSDENAMNLCFRAVSSMQRNMTQGIDVPFTPAERHNSSTPATSQIPFAMASMNAPPPLPLRRS